VEKNGAVLEESALKHFHPPEGFEKRKYPPQIPEA
jgi:hypothetical protein